MRTIAASLTSGLLLAIATPAMAQTWLVPIPRGQIDRINELYDQRWRDFREARRLADRAHFAGECGIRDEALDRAERITRSQMEFIRSEGQWDATQEQAFQNLFAEIAEKRARPCPEPPIEYAEDQVLVPDSTGSTPLSPEERRDRLVSQQQEQLDDFESTLAALERTWRSGDCDSRAALAASFELQAMNDSGLTPPRTMSELYRRFNEIKARPCPPVLPPRLEGRIGVFTYGSGKNVVTGVGVLIDPGNERFVLTSDDEARGEGVEFRIIYNGSPDDRVSVGGRIGRAEERGAASVAPGTSPVGSVYHDRALNGSTGLGLGANGLDAILERDSEYDWFGAAYERRIAGADGGPQVRARALIDFERISDDFDLSLRSPTFPTITMDARQEVRQTNLGIGAGIIVTSPPAASLVWEAFAGAKVYHADSSLDSTQRNVCGLCGAAESDFTVAITDEDKRWGFGAEVGASLGYLFSGGLEIGVQGRADISSDVAGVGNPETGDDLLLRNRPTQLFFDDSFRWSISAYLGFRF